MGKAILIRVLLAWPLALCSMAVLAARPDFDPGARHSRAVDTRGEVAGAGDDHLQRARYGRS